MPPVSARCSRLIALALLFAAGCKQQASEPATNDGSSVENEANFTEVLPLPVPAMDRAAFLGAVSQAASAHTAGTHDRKAQAGLDGRRFAIRLRFGCAGPASPGSSEPLRWSAGKDRTSFEVSATPDLSLDSEPLAGSLDETIETVEGFWLARPWMLSDACPRISAQPDPGAAERPPLVGIAQYFTSDDSRVGQRAGRSYVNVEKIASPDELPKSGLVLLIEGRLRSWPGGKVIRCWGPGTGSPPQCVAAAHVDRAAFERPEDGAVLAEWRR
ncbi:MAG: hypothetical protein ACREB1_10475 [Sphingomicrobium sp.]